MSSPACTISSTGRPDTKPSALSRIECMSWALSLPAMRNLACCQTNRARSRVVKYLRAARPRANQNSEAPIIIVLSTSKNAAAVGSAWTAGGPVTSAAAAEAAPARCARVSSSAVASGVADERPRRGSRGTGNLPAIDPPPGGGSDDSDPSQAAGAPRFVVPTGQQSPIVASGGAQTRTPIRGDDVLGDCPPPTETRGGGSVRSVGIGRWPPTVGGVGTVGNGSPLVPGVPVALPGVPPIDGAAGRDTEGTEALPVPGAAVVVPPVVVPPVVTPPVAGPPAAGERPRQADTRPAPGPARQCPSWRVHQRSPAPCAGRPRGRRCRTGASGSGPPRPTRTGGRRRAMPTARPTVLRPSAPGRPASLRHGRRRPAPSTRTRPRWSGRPSSRASRSPARHSHSPTPAAPRAGYRRGSAACARGNRRRGPGGSARSPV